jgi:hypothetical protein
MIAMERRIYWNRDDILYFCCNFAA